MCVCVDVLLEILHEVSPFFLVSRETALFRQAILSLDQEAWLYTLYYALYSVVSTETER